MQYLGECWVVERRPGRGDVVEFDCVAVRQGRQREDAVGAMRTAPAAAVGAAGTHGCDGNGWYCWLRRGIEVVLASWLLELHYHTQHQIFGVPSNLKQNSSNFFTW